MKFNTITFKLLFFISGTFLLFAIGVVTFADEQLKQIIDHSQNTMYEEKVDAIWQKLNRVNARLMKTGLPEAYGEDFKNSVIAELRSLHYKHQDQKIYPFILDEDGSVVMHPVVPQGAHPMDGTASAEILLGNEKGHLTTTYNGVEKWYEFKAYTPWGWTIAYAVPIEIKYHDANVFITTLIKIIGTSTAVALLLLGIILTRFTRPITKLTEAASQIAQGDLDKEINVVASNEVGILAHNFKEMRDSIQQKINDLNHEIEERKQAERNLQRNEENLRTTLNSIGDAVVATDLEGRVIRMNPVAEQLTGWSFEEACNKPLKEIFHIINGQTKELAESPVDSVLETGQNVDPTDHTLLISRQGLEFQIADSAAPIRTDSGEIIGVVLVFRDVTEEYAIQKQLQQSQKMDAIGQLAGGIAHDFNNMLGGIMGATELLQKYLPDEPKAKKLHSMILLSSEQAAGLTRKLLTFARKETTDNTLVDIHKIINETAHLLKNSIDKRIVLELNLSAPERHVQGDPSQLLNAILNIGINASHAMPNGGTLTITTSTLVLDSVYCNLSSFKLTPGQYIGIEIRDTGSGIDPKILPHIFEPFYTTKEREKGTGLGLSATFGTIQQHHGAISVYSEVEEGTSFNLLLPSAHSQDISMLNASAEQPIVGTGKILVVDDEAVMRQTAQLYLEELGYDVILAENGKQALELYKKSEGAIDLVLLDMVMPVMNGRDCFAALRDMDPEVRVILSSGFSREADILQMQAEGLKDYIRKPYRSASLSKIVSKVLQS